MSIHSSNLKQLAHKVMVENGFTADFEQAVLAQIQGLRAQPEADNGAVRDLRSLLWSSIDNRESRDLDQVEYAEAAADGHIKVLVGVADVDCVVNKDSAIDQHAHANTTSVYTGIETFPMLPERLSTDITSLNEDEDRLVIVTEMVVAPDGTVTSSDVYRAVLRNKAQLNYPDIGDWLDGGQEPDKVSAIPGLSDQLRLQDQVRERLQKVRHDNGALSLETIEATPVMVDGKVVDLELVRHNPARDLIEDFMVTANVTMAKFLERKGVPSIRRVVRTPERWPRIMEIVEQHGGSLPAEPDSLSLAKFLAQQKVASPDTFPDLSLSIVKLLGPGEYTVELPGGESQGHFGLAVHDYTHSTAPNRRFADLVTQRLAKAVMQGGKSPYSDDELFQVAEHCTERESASRKVERFMRKVAAAVLLSNQIGHVFDGIVTGVCEGNCVYARLTKPPAEGRIVRGFEGLDVGQKVRLKLLSTKPEQAHIDFARI